MLDFILFRKMMTPFVIQLFFWFITLVCVIGGIYNFVHHQVAHGLQIILIGPILARMFCEFLLIFFRLNQTLTDLKNSVQEKP